MKRSTFIRIFNAIKQVSNNVSVVENFNHNSLVIFKIPEIVGETPIQRKAFQKLLTHACYYRIVPEQNELVITVQFEWE